MRKTRGFTPMCHDGDPYCIFLIVMSSYTLLGVEGDTSFSLLFFGQLRILSFDVLAGFL
jgi:hypothetical protein